jgi:Glucose / Sorbosone dehydrogenase
MAARRPWRMVTLAPALVLAAGACGQDADQETSSQPGPATASFSTGTTRAATATPVRAGPPTQAELDGVVVRLERLARLREPVALAVADDDTTLLVGERAGRVRAIRGGRLDPRPLLDLTDQVVVEGEGGLLGIAVAPAGRHLYVSFTDRRHAARLVEVTLHGDRVDPASRRDILTVQQPSTRHHGGNIVFGPDGLLWMGIGDGSPGGDPDDAAQSLAALSGKLLRLDPTPTGGKGYKVPTDNPFVGRRGARPEIWAFGLRNPWRFSFDRATGDLWIGDVGQYVMEEIDVVSLRRSTSTTTTTAAARWSVGTSIGAPRSAACRAPTSTATCATAASGRLPAPAAGASATGTCRYGSPAWCRSPRTGPASCTRSRWPAASIAWRPWAEGTFGRLDARPVARQLLPVPPPETTTEEATAAVTPAITSSLTCLTA